jgi:hypothetical protein
MKHDDWFCMDCMAVRDLDIHARCDCCGSDSVTPAAGHRQGNAVTPYQSPLPLIFRITEIVGRKSAVLRQTIQLVARARCRPGYAEAHSERRNTPRNVVVCEDAAAIGS